jgi:hypothetical protein
MERITEFKDFYHYKSIEELQYESYQWKSNLDFLKFDLEFLKDLLKADIYKSDILNLFETLELFKKDIDKQNDERSKLFDSVTFHIEHLEKKKQCKKANCNQFYIEIHEKMAYDVAVFFEESNNLKHQIFEYINSVIIK